LGISYGPQIQVYYLIAFWLFVSAVCMFGLTHTPLGRLANAVRDNPERLEFIGYDTQWVRYLTLILSAFFAGIAGGLSAINFEIVSAENVSAIRSGAVLLFTFIGGIGFFFGPMLGAIIGVVLTVVLADLTKAWQLYLGLFFIVIVMYAPGGIASVLMMNLRLMQFGLFKRIWPAMWKMILACSLASAGLVMAIEMLYHRSTDFSGNSEIHLFSLALDTATPVAWLWALALVALGLLIFFRCKPKFSQDWSELNSEIEATSARAKA
jgi:branched-chain amino acid transport system permease protein